MSLPALIGHISEFFITFLFFTIVFELKKKRLFTIVSGFLMYSVVFLVYLTFDSTFINIASGTLFNFIFGFTFFKCTAKTSFLCSLFLTISLTASEFIVMAFMSFNNNNINVYKSSVSFAFLMILISRIIYLTLTLLVASFFPKDKIKKIPTFLIFFPITSTIVLYTLWFVSSEIVAVSQKANNLIVVASISVLISVLLTYIFYSKTYKELNELYIEKNEHERIKIETTYYSILDKQNTLLKTILHDEKNHLAVIKSLANKPDVSKYIDEIYGDFFEYSLFGNTKNKILDLIINKYQYICEEKNIDFYISIKTANLSYIESSDLTTLFGNLLDNAVEAATGTKSAKIDLSLNKVNELDVLTCINSCNQKPQSIGNSLLTTKNDANFHGLGLKSIKRVVKKYHGTFEWSYDDVNKEFTVYIVF